MRRWLLIGGWLIGCGLLAGNAAAAGIDCSKARSVTEKAICGSPALLSLDRSIADAYADQLARQPDRREQAQRDLIAWLKHRDATCAGASNTITQCLTGELTARLAALAPTVAPPPVTAAVVGPPVPPVPQREPAIPRAFNPPAPAATLEASSVPAAERAATLLHVTSPGRFTIAAHSPSGAALQLIDMLAGPSAVSGGAGSQDGRLDLLLDIGTYKLLALSAKAATGAVALSVAPFTDAAPPQALPAPGTALDAELRDGTQRAFWLAVPQSGALRIEAVGRSLADLRLWRDGRDLSALEPETTLREPTPGHPVNHLLLAGTVEPGTYLAVAYGGAPLRWTDNDTTQPFHLRPGASAALADGWAFGVIGAFGGEVFTLPASAASVRLDLPAAAAASLSAGDASAVIGTRSREPSATLVIPDTKPETIELTGAAGQPFKLQALAIPATLRVTKPGTYWVSAVTAGTGGDEVPPSVLLERTEGSDKPPRIVAAVMPVLSPTAAWRGRFNLRGPTTLLFQNAAGGAIGVRSAGVATRNGRGRTTEFDLPSDYYAVEVSPAGDAQGFVDLVVGPAGQNTAATPPLPVNPVLPLGVQTVERGQTLRLSSVRGPGVSVGLSARPSPVALAEGSLSVTLTAGSTLSIPVLIAPGGALTVNEGGGGPVPFTMQDTRPGGSGTVVLAASDRARTIVLAWRRDAAPRADIRAPPPLDSVAGLQAGRPVFLDLRANQQRGFALTVPQGGLYRVETLGRLHTSGRLATPFIPALGEGDANGIGQNMLVQSVLRAGRYRVEVTALESSGHLGVSATPATMLEGATLLPGGSVRASLTGGAGIGFPIEIAAAGRYHLEVASLGSPWAGRIEDADGWPITAPGPLDDTEMDVQPGRYRMLVMPDAVARQVVARLTLPAKPVSIDGHGPHPLVFETPASAVWREPAGRDQPRTPDSWLFGLEGPADTVIVLGDGMVGQLQRDGTAIARLTGRYQASLAAGRYRLDVSSLGRNDRLNYTVSLTTKALQPDVPRSVTLPASVPFAIAQSRVVSLTSFGDTPVKAVLRRAEGGVVARIGPRADDWNIAASQPLPAGDYTLELAAASPPDTTAVDTSTPSTADDSDKPNDDDDQAAQTAATQTAAGGDDAAKTEPADAPSDDDAKAPTVELRLALPAAREPVAAPSTLTALAGGGVHVMSVPQPAAGSLLVAWAQASVAIVLTLERQEADGWVVVGLEQGLAPRVASPADGEAKPWRVRSWTVDGGTEPIRVAARSIEAEGQSPGAVALARVDDGLAVAKVQLGAAGPAAITGAPGGLLAAGWPGHGAAPIEGATVLSQGAEMWLIGLDAARVEVTARMLAAGETLALVLPAGLVATLPPRLAAANHVALWRAESGLGLPGLGSAMGVAADSTLALGQGAVSLRNASSDAKLRLRLTAIDAALLPAQTLQSALHTSLAAGVALPVVLPPGDKQIQLDLAPGVAAVAGWPAPGGPVVWTGGAPVSRMLAGGWTQVLLVNTGAAAAPAGVSWQGAPPPPALRPGSVFKRFFGASGSFETAAEAAAGARLVTAGNASLVVIMAGGRVLRGHDVALDGPARVVVETTPGAMAVWETADGVSPWPAPVPQPASVPSRIVLAGPAMALTVQTTKSGADTPVVLHARTTAPVLLSLVQGGGGDTPTLFAAGAELHRMLAAGPAELRIYSPHDGPLSGTLALSADPIIPMQEGIGAEISVAPGGVAVFGFSLSEAATIGVGVRANPDRVSLRLLDADGKLVGEGVAQLRRLPAGRYALEAQVPPDGAPTLLRPAIVGITPPGHGPPPDVAQGYLELVGMKPQGRAP